MVTFRESFEAFCFSVMESSFCFANVEFVTVPAASFIDDFGPEIGSSDLCMEKRI